MLSADGSTRLERSRLGPLDERLDDGQGRGQSIIGTSSRLRKKAFRTLLSLSVISPRGGELNTSGAERRSELTSPRGANQNTSGAKRRSELTSPRGANQKGRKPALSQSAERLFIGK